LAEFESIVIDKQYLFSLLKEMIKINSILGQESNLAHYLFDEIKKLGMHVELEEVSPNRENIYAKYQFDTKGKTLTLNGHLDTVEVCAGWNTDPFQPMEKDGKLIGLGSVDMKGGLACQLAAVKALIESDVDLQGTIHYTAVVDEEGFGTGAKKMLSNPNFGKGATDGVVISEPCYGQSPDNALPLGMTGKVLYKIAVIGKSAHAFTPEKGVNAVTDASRILTAVDVIDENPSIKKFPLPTEEDFGEGSFCVLKIGEGSFCVLKIEGGYKTYSVVVPERCDFELNRLTVPGETKESVKEDFNQFIKEMQIKSNVTIEIIPPFYLPYKIAKDHPLFQSLEESFVSIFKKQPFTTYSKMITDANTFMGEGDIPTVIFGPRGGNLHAADEFVEMNSLVPAANVFAQLFTNFQKK